MSESQKEPDDDFVKQLRAAARRKRPWSLTTWLITILTLGVPLGLGVWWFWPAPLSPRLAVIAFDVVALPDTPLTLRAAVEDLDGGNSALAGRELYFVELGRESEALKVAAGAGGIAQTAWTLKTPPPFAELEVRYLDLRARPPWSQWDRIRIFTWPKKTRIVAIDVEPTLKGAADRPTMAKALAAVDQAGWRLVYLAVDAGTPLAFRRLRDWELEQEALLPQPLPKGPVLARAALGSNEAEASGRKKVVLARLRAHFAGPVLYLTADKGLTLQKVEPGGDFDKERTEVKDWAKLAEVLKGDAP
jgi:hypothetical protein